MGGEAWEEGWAQRPPLCTAGPPRLLVPCTSGGSRNSPRHVGAHTWAGSTLRVPPPSSLREPIQGLTLPQDVPQHRPSAHQQDWHGVVLLLRCTSCSPQSGETEAQRGVAKSGAGNTNIPQPKPPLPPPQQAPHPSPCPILLTHRHQEDPDPKPAPKHPRTRRGLPREPRDAKMWVPHAPSTQLLPWPR